MSALIPGGGNRLNSMGASAKLYGNRSREDQITRRIASACNCGGGAFNAFNRTQLWMPVTGFGNLDFGKITVSQQTVLPRVMRFAVKLDL